MKEIIKNICCLKDHELYYEIIVFLESKGYKNIKEKEGQYIFAEGDNEYPVALIAHLDTVFYTPLMENFYFDQERKVLWNPNGSGFDDRAGVVAIMSIIAEGYRPTVIFTFGEEVGGVGASALIRDYPSCPIKNCKALIELDRAGFDDMVFYNCDNKDFISYIESFGFELQEGTFTDISILAPTWKIAAVNLSIGYEYEHTKGELLHLDWFNEIIKKVKNILMQSNTMKKYKYIEKVLDNSYLRNMFKTEVDYQSKCICCEKKIPAGKGISFDGIHPYVLCKECYDAYF
jgi:hypothetical protein